MTPRIPLSDLWLFMEAEWKHHEIMANYLAQSGSPLVAFARGRAEICRQICDLIDKAAGGGMAA